MVAKQYGMKNLTKLKLTIYSLLLMLLLNCTDDDPIQYELKTSCAPDKTGTVTPESGMFDEGMEIELKATPIPEYVFKSWEGDASGDENPMKITMVKDRVITAVFEKVNYSLNIQVIGEGTVNEEIIQAKSSTVYESGTKVQLTAVPDEEWEFVRWSGDIEVKENPTQINMTKPLNITAVFQKVKYSLTVHIDGEGTVTEQIIRAKTSSEYASGTTVQLTALPDDEWEFAGWTDSYNGTENPIQLTLKKDLILTAKFEFKSLDKTYVPDDNFERALIELGFDDVMDNYVLNNKIDKVLSLNIENRQIEDLTGIEGFKSLLGLLCENNQLISLDISSNIYLRLLLATDNPLSCVKVNEDQLEFYTQGGWSQWTGYFTDDDVLFSHTCNWG